MASDGIGSAIAEVLKETEEEKKLKMLILAQLDQTLDDWTGSGLEINSNDYSLTQSQRNHVQNVGKEHGCHTCGTRVDKDKNQPWIGDHIPPWELSDKVRKDAGVYGDKTYLFPQCDECAHSQSFYVKMLNAGIETWGAMVKSDKPLIVGGWKASPEKNCVETNAKKVSAAQGIFIQGVGEKKGCHSCGSKYPAKVYISDHIVPQEFCTSYMPQVFKALGIPYPDTFELRPQCPKCSGFQGGKMKEIMTLAVSYAKRKGITVYK
ncbi:MAG TPA: hypothetical protein VGY31_04425 [Terriglobia bacterium]|nr:hypothetical protein [Terriglobia bacterium]